MHHDHFGWYLAWGEMVYLSFMYTLQVRIKQLLIYNTVPSGTRPGTFTPSTCTTITLDGTRGKINIYFSGATFQACLHEYNILKFVLHWTLCKFMGALFWFWGALLGISGAISPRAPVYFFHWMVPCLGWYGLRPIHVYASGNYVYIYIYI